MEPKEKCLSHENLHDWKETKLNIGIIGDTDDEFKSLLINKLTGFSNQIVLDKDNKLKIYKHFNNLNFCVWDLNPDEEFDVSNIEDYLNKLDFEKFDFFILFRNKYFQDIDLKIVNEIEKRNKKVYLVTVYNQKEEKLKQDDINNESAEQTIDKIKSELQEKLKKENIYILSKDEFPKLNQDIINDLKQEKMQAYVLTIEPLTKEIIEKKAEVLKSRASDVSTISTLFGSFLSLPGLAIIADITLLTSEIWFYRKQLGLTWENFRKYSNKSKDFFEHLINIISSSKNGAYLILNDIHSLSGMLIKTLPMFLISDITDFLKFLPLVRSILHGTVSIATTKYALIQLIEEFSKIAIDIQNLVQKPDIITVDQQQALTHNNS